MKEGISILSLNEAHNSNFFLPDYVSVLCSKDLCVLVKRNINFSLVKKVVLPYADILVLCFGNRYFIFSYLRDGKCREGISTLIEELLFLGNRKIFVVGDLNCRMEMLGNRSHNLAGKLLQEFLESRDDFFVMNEPFKFTFERRSPYNGSQTIRSVLDLCLCNQTSLGEFTSFEVLSNFGSDHFPVFMEIGETCVEDFINLSEYEECYNLRSKNLHFIKNFPETFPNAVSRRAELLLGEAFMLTADDLWNQIQKLIYEALHESSLLKPKSSHRRHYPLPNYLLQLRQTNRNKFRREVWKYRTEKWHKFVASINSDFDRASLWRKFRRSLGSKRTGVQHGDLQKEVNAIKETFRRNSIPEIFPIASITTRSSSNAVDVSWNTPFTYEEVNTAIAQANNSAPGPDGIPNNLFKALPDSAKFLMTSLLNKLFFDQEIPLSMKACFQVAFPKSIPGEYRPVTLMNSVVKLFELLLLNRIADYLNNFLPKEQFGFRKKLSSADQAAHFIMHAQSGRNRKKCCGAVFLDIKKAFDRVDRKILLEDLCDNGIQGRMLNAISNLLHGNRYRVFFQDLLSEEYVMDYGTPQGSLLSPLLWNFYFRDVINQAHQSRVFGFADDVALYYEASNYDKLFHVLTCDLNRMNQFCFSRSIELSTTKTKFVDFSPKYRKRRREENHAVLLKDLRTQQIMRLEQTSSYKYLGVIIDEELTFKEWISKICTEGSARLTLVSRLARTLKLQRKTIEMFYSQYVRGYLHYGMSIWSTLPPHIIEKIHILDRKGMRMCVGALQRTSTDALINESNIPNLDALRQKSVLNQGLRTFFLPEHSFFKSNLLDFLQCSDLANSWMECWSQFELHRSPNIDLARARIAMDLIFTKRHWKYRKDNWEERTLSRIRMQVLPTRSWAVSVSLTESPLCRHCNSAEETADHLFFTCAVINMEKMIEFQQEYPDLLIGNFVDLANLMNVDSKARPSLENAALQHIRLNKLFKY
jgi:hypothetical protein